MIEEYGEYEAINGGIANELTKKVERLEKAIWHAAHKQFEKSPKEIEAFIAHIYAGECDEEFDLAIEECKKEWGV